MRVIALDLSLTSTGWALGVGGVISAHGLIPGKGDGVPRLIHNRNVVCAAIDTTQPDLVVFEDFSFGSDLSYVREIAAMAYMIRAELFVDKVPYLCVSPLALKKFICGTAGSAKNKVTKDLVLKEVFKRWGHDVNDNNIADAIGLAYIGMAVMDAWEPTTDAQREVMDTLRKKNPWLSSLDKANNW